jgi:hypothetical protein
VKLITNEERQDTLGPFTNENKYEMPQDENITSKGIIEDTY